MCTKGRGDAGGGQNAPVRGEAGGGACYAITGEAAVGAEKERRLGKGSMVLSEEGRGRRGSRSGKAMI